MFCYSFADVQEEGEYFCIFDSVLLDFLARQRIVLASSYTVLLSIKHFKTMAQAEQPKHIEMIIHMILPISTILIFDIKNEEINSIT